MKRVQRQWLLLGGLFLLPVLVLLFSGVSKRFSTDLLDLAPADSSAGQAGSAMRAANKVLARQVFVIIDGVQDGEQREAITHWLHDVVVSNPIFANVFIPGGRTLPKPMLEVLQERKLSLLLPAWLERRRAEYDEEGPEVSWVEWLAKTQAKQLDRFLSSPFGDEYASQVTKDPLLLLPDAARTMGKDSLPNIEPGDGPWLVWLGLRANPLDGEEQDVIAQAVNRLQSDFQNVFPGLSIETAGVYQVAQEASAASEAEVTRLNGWTAAAVLLLLVVFMWQLRSLLTLLIPITAAVLWALAAGLIVFERIHIFAIGMSAVLLGLAVDYGIHAEMHRLTSRRQGSVWEAVKKPLLAGCLSSCFGFLIMFEAPILALRQVAVLVPAGLCGALLSVCFLYQRRGTVGAPGANALRYRLPPIGTSWLFGFFGLTGVVALLVLFAKSQREDSLEDFQIGSGAAQEHLVSVIQQAAQIAPGSQWVLYGDSPQSFYEGLDALQKEEDGPSFPFAKVIRPVDTVSLSEQERRDFVQAFRKELEARDFDAEAFEPSLSELERTEPGAAFGEALGALNFTLPGPLGLTLGYDDDIFFSAFMAKSPDTSLPIARLAEREQLNLLLARASQSLMWQCIYGWPIVALALVIVFKWRDGLSIGLLMLWAGLCGAALQLLVLGHFSLLGWIGLILACCLAIDYGAFAIVERGQPLPSVRLSMLTTLSAFAILGTSDIVAIRALGLSVVFSVATATLGVELLNARKTVACQDERSA